MKKLPSQGFVFWPVGNGDSTTIVVKDNAIVMQVDIRHCEEAEDDDSPMLPVIDELVRLLPKKNGKPYLALFALTHPDKDHVLGFPELLKRVTIGEIWHTPRVFKEFKKDLCDDAKAFTKEVQRRVDLTIEKNGEVASGDRVRIIGHDDMFLDEYKDFPKRWRTTPGNSVTEIDGQALADVFEAFIHAPFQDDMDEDRNNTSLAFQINLREGDNVGKGLFFGDREYPLIKKIFDKTKKKKRPQYLEWDVMLSPHHCSKSAMYWADGKDKEEELKQDIMDDFEAARRAGGKIIASSRSDFSDEEGKLPPHLKARRRYEEIVDAGCFKCTHEHPNKKEPQPIVFAMDKNGLAYQAVEGQVNATSILASAVSSGRGGEKPPVEKVGFGSL